MISADDTLSTDATARLRAIAAHVSASDLRCPNQVLSAGIQLVEAKGLIGRGGFVSWYSKHVNHSGRHVRRLLQVAKNFQRVDFGQVGQFDSAALFLLSEKRCPPEARRLAIEAAGRGEEVTYSRARELRLQIAPPRRRGQRRVKQLDSERAEQQTKVEELTPEHVAWLNLESLIDTSTMIHLSRETDEESGDTVIVGRSYPEDLTLQPRVGVRGSLAGVIGYLSGREKVKVCAACKSEKSADEFALNESTADGRSYRCLVCERRRIAKMARKTKGQQ